MESETGEVKEEAASAAVEGAGDGEVGAGVDAPEVASAEVTDTPAEQAPDAAAATAAEDVPVEDEFAEAVKAGNPRVALVGKYNDRVPVQLTSRSHLARLLANHPGSVELLEAA